MAHSDLFFVYSHLVTSAMPEGLMVDCISFVHTKIYPLARNLKQRMNKK